VHQVHFVCLDYKSTSALMAVHMHEMNSNCERSGRSQPAGAKIMSGNSVSFIDIV